MTHNIHWQRPEVDWVKVNSFMITLVMAMTARRVVKILANGITYVGIINKIEAEDGSGHRFNIELHDSTKFYVDVAYGCGVM